MPKAKKSTLKKVTKKPAIKLKPRKYSIAPEVVDRDHEDGPSHTAASEPGLVGGDPLQKYLADIRRYPLLTPEQERELAVKVKETGDKKSAELLVTSNLRFVVKVAAEYSRFGARMIDLIQEGNVGLIHAVKEFNPYKGVRLITYAVWWIRGYIQEYLMKNYSQVKIGTTQAQKKLFYHLNKEKARLDSMGEKQNTKVLSERLGVTEQEVVEMTQRLSGHDLSLDAPIGSGEDSNARTFLENQADDSATAPDDALAGKEEKIIFRREIKKIVKLLNEKEKYILEKRVLGDPPLTLQEVGDHFGITRERARQLEERVLLRMREHMQKVFPDYKINNATD